MYFPGGSTIKPIIHYAGFHRNFPAGKFLWKSREVLVKAVDTNHETGMSRRSFGLSNHLNMLRWFRQSLC